MHRFPALAACLLGGFLVACSGAPPESGSDYEVTGDKAPAASAAAASTADAPTAPPAAAPSPPTGTAEPSVTAAPSKSYRGTLAATAKVPFGGSPYCNYDITLKTIAIDVTVLDTGGATAATVTDTAVESTTQCVYAPMKPAAQSFTLSAATVVPTGVHLEFAGAATNEPKTSLVVDLVSNKTGGYDAKLSWKRVDLPGTLAWAVSTTVALSAQ